MCLTYSTVDYGPAVNTKSIMEEERNILFACELFMVKKDTIQLLTFDEAE